MGMKIQNYELIYPKLIKQSRKLRFTTKMSYSIVWLDTQKYNLPVNSCKPKLSIESLIFTESFIEIKLSLPEGKLYGIGERRGSVELNDTDWWEHRKG